MTTTTTKTMLGILLALASGSAACAAPAEPSEDPVADESAFTENACSPAAYNEALDSYKVAVANAKRFLRGVRCEEGVTVLEINNDLGAAVKACGAFEKVIAESPWAQPARDVLDGNLALAALTGKLKVRDASGAAKRRSFADALPGVTIFGPAPGAFGNESKITFAENGEAIFYELVTDGGPYWQDEQATYEVGVRAADGSIRVIVRTDQQELDFTVIEEPRGDGPAFRFQPAGASEYEAFSSLPSECEA
jgi:hypothetical protein